MTTISNNYFEEYTEFINDLQNRIMKIQLKYNECQSLISSDFSKGFIAKEVAEKMLAVKINQFAPSMDRMYRLSKADVDFINQYAALDSCGNVLATILKPEYLAKAEQLELILKSVQTAHYYESLEPSSKRIKIKMKLTNAFNKRVSLLKAKASNMLRVRGEAAKESESYQQIIAEIEKCTSAIESFDQVMDYDDATVRELLESFYKIDYAYFDWYQNMELKSLKETNELYTEHSSTMARVNDYGKDLLDNQSKTREASKTLIDLNNKLMSFLDAIMNIDLSSFEEEQPKGFAFFRKSKSQENNKEVLSDLFLNLSALPGVIDYFQETYANDGESIELTECFNKYFNQIYGEETTYADLTKFLLAFQKSVVTFYKAKIEKIQKELESQIKISGGINVALVSGIEKGYSQALLHEKAFNAATIDQSSLLLEGFDEEELQKIYHSLKNIINPSYGFNPNDVNPAQKKGLK